MTLCCPLAIAPSGLSQTQSSRVSSVPVWYCWRAPSLQPAPSLDADWPLWEMPFQPGELITFHKNWKPGRKSNFGLHFLLGNPQSPVWPGKQSRVQAGGWVPACASPSLAAVAACWMDGYLQTPPQGSRPHLREHAQPAPLCAPAQIQDLLASFRAWSSRGPGPVVLLGSRPC
jgi:hypothetical protein